MIQHVVVSVAGTIKPVLLDTYDGLVLDCSMLTTGQVNVTLPTPSSGTIGKPIWVLSGGAIVEFRPTDTLFDAHLSPKRLIGGGKVCFTTLPKGTVFEFVTTFQQGTLVSRQALFPALYWDDTRNINDFDVLAEELPLTLP